MPRALNRPCRTIPGAIGNTFRFVAKVDGAIIERVELGDGFRADRSIKIKRVVNGCSSIW